MDSKFIATDKGKEVIRNGGWGESGKDIKVSIFEGSVYYDDLSDIEAFASNCTEVTTLKGGVKRKYDCNAKNLNKAHEKQRKQKKNLVDRFYNKPRKEK